MKQIIEDNYKSIVKRGLIKKETTKKEFIDKIYEEVKELEEAESIEENSFEMADIILTVLNFAHHFDIDIETILKKKIQINQNR
jgi:NTP pyrophosphatase (non-canonical NTP hydrolase)